MNLYLSHHARAGNWYCSVIFEWLENYSFFPDLKSTEAGLFLFISFLILFFF